MLIALSWRKTRYERSFTYPKGNPTALCSFTSSELGLAYDSWIQRPHNPFLSDRTDALNQYSFRINAELCSTTATNARRSPSNTLSSLLYHLTQRTKTTMEDITRLSEQLHKLDVRHVVPTPAKSVFPCGVIGGNPIGPNNTTPIATREDEIKALTTSSRDTNPFYDPDLDLGAAAKYLHRILRTALGACEAWLKVPVDRVVAMANKSGNQNPLICMCRDFNHILLFLEHGRRGFDLTFLPDNFFADVETLLPDLLIKVEQLSEIEDCAFLYETGVVVLRDLKVKLAEIEDLRIRIWLQTKEKYERKRVAERKILPVRKTGLNTSCHANGDDESPTETNFNIAFTGKQEFKAGRAMKLMEDGESTRDLLVALDQNPEVKGLKEVAGSGPIHGDGGDATESDSVPSADRAIDPERTLYVEEEFEIETSIAEKVVDEMFSDDEKINPEFALFVEDEEESDVRDDNTANVVEEGLTKTKGGLLALEASCEGDASGGTKYGES